MWFWQNNDSIHLCTQATLATNSYDFDPVLTQSSIINIFRIETGHKWARQLGLYEVMDPANPYPDYCAISEFDMICNFYQKSANQLLTETLARLWSEKNNEAPKIA